MSSGIAVSIAPGELRLLVARTNGSVRPLHHLATELPDGAVRCGLQPPNLSDPVAVREALQGLVREAGSAARRSKTAAVLVPDAAVRLAVVPIEVLNPSRSEAEAMARWALRDMLPVGADECRIDWSVLAADDAPGRWLLAVGADTGVIEEYESIIAAVGWTAGRVVPLTLALAVAAGDADPRSGSDGARLVLSGIGGQVACLVEAGGVPRLHRAWRGRPPELGAELRTIRRYVDTRLDRSIDEAVLAGSEQWQEETAHACRALGWNVHALSSWSAHLSAISP